MSTYADRLTSRFEFGRKFVRDKRAYIVTTGFYFAERIVLMVLSVIVYMVLARAYGPEKMGVFSYGQTLVSFAAPFLAPGAEAIVVRELVRHPDRRDAIMGSAFILLTALTVAVTLIPIGYAMFAPGGDPLVLRIVVLMSISFLPNALLVIEHAFKADMKAASIVIPRATVMCASAAVKVWLATHGYSIVAVAGAFAGEAILIGLAMSAVYIAGGRSPWRWRFQWKEIEFLFRQALPAMLSAAVVLLFFRINHLLIGLMSNYTELGKYSLAFQIAQVFGIFPMVIFSTVYPRLVSLHSENPAYYRRIMNLAYFAMALLSYVMLVGTYFLSGFVVTSTFGTKFAGTDLILNVLTIGMVFNFLGSVRAQEINIMNVPKYHVANALAGLVVLVPVSLVLIPRYGALGGAWGVAIGSLVSSILTSFMFQSTRSAGIAQLRSLILLPRLR